MKTVIRTITVATLTRFVARIGAFYPSLFETGPCTVRGYREELT